MIVPPLQDLPREKGGSHWKLHCGGCGAFAWLTVKVTELLPDVVPFTALADNVYVPGAVIEIVPHALAVAVPIPLALTESAVPLREAPRDVILLPGTAVALNEYGIERGLQPFT